jgi:hypothetical protein
MKKLLRLLAEVDQKESLYLYQRTSLVPSVIEGHRFRTDHKRSFSESSRSHLIRKIRIRQRHTRFELDRCSKDWLDQTRVNICERSKVDINPGERNAKGKREQSSYYASNR